LKSKDFSLKLLLEAKDDYPKHLSDSLQLQITPSDIVIATTQNEKVEGIDCKRSIKIMKLKVARI
jgi:hypothetical protein